MVLLHAVTAGYYLRYDLYMNFKGIYNKLKYGPYYGLLLGGGRARITPLLTVYTFPYPSHDSSKQEVSHCANSQDNKRNITSNKF